MPLRLGTNITSINAGRHLNRNTGDFTRRVERLSSGLRINRGADDAAGLSVSEGMRAELLGMRQGVRNAEQGVSLIQLAEGSLNEVSTMLTRMRELAVTSANSTINDQNRGSLTSEFNQLTAEIDRIALSTTYNKTVLLTGFGNAVSQNSLVSTALDGFAGVAGWEVDVGSVIDQMLAGVGGVLRLTIKPKRHVPINSLFVEALGSADVTDFFDVTLGFVTDNAVATALPPISAPPRRELLATGSGFAVTRDGYLVTNQHVVDGCASVKVKNARGVHDVRVVTSDKHNDVALLQMAGKMRAAAYFRADRGVRTGDAVLAYGFPLQGLLSEEAKPTRGMINSLAGLDNDSRFMQISAPVHSGNSGGPLLDYSGNVIGIVTSKLDAIHMMEIHDEIPQNVNFALKSSLVRDFLDANRVNYDIRASTSPLDSATIITDANRYTYLVECWQ